MAVQLAPLSLLHSSVTVVGWKPVQVRFQRKPIASAGVQPGDELRLVRGARAVGARLDEPRHRPVRIMSRSAFRSAMFDVANAAGVCELCGLTLSKSVWAGVGI
jgi:hypothetical protein